MFHVSIAENSIKNAISFYELLGGRVSYESPLGYVNITIHDCQLTIHEKRTVEPLSDFHFGFNTTKADFQQIVTKISNIFPNSVRSGPLVVDRDTPRERMKMFLQSPSGHLIEIKGIEHTKL